MILDLILKMIIPDSVTVDNVDKYIYDQLFAMLSDPYLVAIRRLMIKPNNQTAEYVIDKYELVDNMVDPEFAYEVAGLIKEYNTAFLNSWNVPIPQESPGMQPVNKRVKWDQDLGQNMNITFLGQCGEYNIISAMCSNDDYMIFYFHPWRLVRIKGKMLIPKLQDYWDAKYKEYRVEVSTLMRIYPKYNRTILSMVNSRVFKY